MDANSLIAHAQLVEKAKQGRIDVYFVGDSITRRWGATDYPHLLENWKRNFFGWNAANFGWGGDRTQNILWRLQNGEFESVKPRVVVLQAGTNNIARNGSGSADAMAADLTRGVEAILRVIREKAPGATVVLTGLFPRNDIPTAWAVIERANAKLAQLADGRQVRFLNINPQLADAKGRLHPGMMDPDGLHPTVKTYQIWADALKPVLQEVLGPPAAEDLAPPPTGDPSAQPARRLN
jgi:lysophospholipase L1-like esterase